jgi:hypothetical protein
MASIFFMRLLAPEGAALLDRGFSEIAGLVPGFFAAFPLVFKDLVRLPTGAGPGPAHIQGRLLDFEAARPVV